MFARVARRYDLLNHLLSASLDRLWRRKLARSLARALPPGSRILDLCAGTGDQALALGRRGFEVLAADFCVPMLVPAPGKLARLEGRKALVLAADALRLPLSDASVDGVTVSFGLRNVARLEQALDEIRRVLRPRGELGILEFGLPRAAGLRQVYGWYFERVLPRVGSWISGDGEAYRYLPASVGNFPQGQEFLERLRSRGFAEPQARSLSGGILYLYRARKPQQ